MADKKPGNGRYGFAHQSNPSSKWTADDHLLRAHTLLDFVDSLDGRDRVYTIQSATAKIEAHLAMARYKAEVKK